MKPQNYTRLTQKKNGSHLTALSLRMSTSCFAYVKQSHGTNSPQRNDEILRCAQNDRGEKVTLRLLLE